MARHTMRWFIEHPALSASQLCSGRAAHMHETHENEPGEDTASNLDPFTECALCYTGAEDYRSVMLISDTCSQGFHLSGLQLPLQNSFKGPWEQISHISMSDPDIQAPV